MGNFCDLCRKGPISGKNVSKSNRRTPRRWLPNLHPKRILVGTTTKKLWVCTKCLRKLKSKRA